MVDTMRELDAEELANVAGGGFGSLGSSVAKTGGQKAARDLFVTTANREG